MEHSVSKFETYFKSLNEKLDASKTERVRAKTAKHFYLSGFEVDEAARVITVWRECEKRLN